MARALLPIGETRTKEEVLLLDPFSSMHALNHCIPKRITPRCCLVLLFFDGAADEEEKRNVCMCM